VAVVDCCFRLGWNSLRMSLSNKVKVGLDETRILIPGSQIALGFQIQGAFCLAFVRLLFHDRVV